MRSEAQKIRERYESMAKKEVDDLQKGCSHGKLTVWMDLQWAPAHSTGFEVQLCARCDKEMHRRTRCGECGKSIADGEIVEGSMENGCPIGGNYCRECVSKVARRTTRDMRKFQITKGR